MKVKTMLRKIDFYNMKIQKFSKMINFNFRNTILNYMPFDKSKKVN